VQRKRAKKSSHIEKFSFREKWKSAQPYGLEGEGGRLERGKELNLWCVAPAESYRGEQSMTGACIRRKFVLHNAQALKSAKKPKDRGGEEVLRPV